MKFSSTKALGQRGWNYVENVALSAQCKAMPVPDTMDTGIDGFIELVKNNEALGRVIAVQVKRGNSFFVNSQPTIKTDKSHLLYWRDFCVPVLLIAVSENGAESYWMDVQQHLRHQPDLVDNGPYVLHLPKSQRFSVEALTNVIFPRYAKALNVGEAISLLCSEHADHRIAGAQALMLFKSERTSVFALTSALCFETETNVLRLLCDILSRYLPHPEASFPVPSTLRQYATDLLQRIDTPQLIHILESLFDDDYNLSAAVEFFHLAEEEIWPPQEMVERGSIQQSIAVVVGALAGGDRLLSIISDHGASIESRRGAAALFGYLGYTCESKAIESAAKDTQDPTLHALLAWLHYWIRYEHRTTEGGAVGTPSPARAPSRA